MRNSTLEFLLWLNHFQALEFGMLGVIMIIAGMYLPMGKAYMQIQLVCYFSTSIRKLLTVNGGIMIFTGAMNAFWYRKHREIIYLIYIMLIVLSIIFTILLSIFVSHNCDSKYVKKNVENLWLYTEKENNAFFMMQQHLKCCGKTGESDYIEKEPFPVCHKNFNEDDIQFTEGCFQAAEKYYQHKSVETVVIASIIVIMEFKGLGLSIILYRTRNEAADISMQHTVSYTT